MINYRPHLDLRRGIFHGWYLVCHMILLLAGGLVLTAPVSAIPLRATSAPIINGTGASMTARWTNVGQLEGQDIDLFLEVVSHTGQAKWVMVTENDDFKFQFTDGSAGEARSATLRWTFFEAGTSNPVTVPELAFTVDDLDDNIRHESLSTQDAYGYVVNDPTEISHSMTGGTVSAAGSDDIAHNSGEPEGAVKLLFAEKSSIVVTYNTVFDGATLSAFHHDGDGDFVFDHSPMELYYTFDLTNRKDYDTPVSFTNTLPPGLVWDPEYIEITGQLTGSPIQFSNGNKTVSSSYLVLHSGSNHLKLKTTETVMSGEITVEAILDPLHPQVAPIVQSTTITLPQP